MQSKENAGLCPFRCDCSFPGSGCSDGGFLNCYEAEKRKTALDMPCPLMNDCVSNKCNVPQFRVFLDDLGQCSLGKCPVTGRLGHILKATDFRDIQEVQRPHRRSPSEIALLRAAISH